MKLAELAKKSGISVSTLYEYLRSGILHPPERISPTKSVFNTSHLKRLKKVRTLRKKERLSLLQIKKRLNSTSETAIQADGCQDVKTQIIDTALTLFSRAHYDKTKISDITKALDMGNGTFYRYFSSKEELFLHCLERLPKKMVSREAWNEVKRETDCITRLRKRGNAMLEAFHSYIGMLNHTKLVLGGEDKLLATKAAECLKSLSAPLRKDLEQAIADGQIRKIDPDLISYLLLGMNETFGHRLLMDETYTVENGFHLIEEFLRCALAPSKTLMAPHFEITLENGSRLSLSQISYQKKNFIFGDFCGGRLKIPFSSAPQIAFTHTPKCSIAHIVNAFDQEGKISVDPASKIEGTTSLGHFSIATKEVQTIIPTPQ